MPYLITLDNMLDGVGDYPGVPKHELLSLLPGEDRKKGLSDGLARFIDLTWDRLETDSRDMDRLDLTGTLPTEIIPLVRAAQCHYLLHLLHRRSRTHAHDRHNMEQREHLAEYKRIRGRIRVQMPSGRPTNVGQANRFIRG